MNKKIVYIFKGTTSIVEEIIGEILGNNDLSCYIEEEDNFDILKKEIISSPLILKRDITKERKRYRRRY